MWSRARQGPGSPPGWVRGEPPGGGGGDRPRCLPRRGASQGGRPQPGCATRQRRGGREPGGARAGGHRPASRPPGRCRRGWDGRQRQGPRPSGPAAGAWRVRGIPPSALRPSPPHRGWAMSSARRARRTARPAAPAPVRGCGGGPRHLPWRAWRRRSAAGRGRAWRWMVGRGPGRRSGLGGRVRSAPRHRPRKRRRSTIAVGDSARPAASNRESALTRATPRARADAAHAAS